MDIPTQFDFDQWKLLAEQDPKAFEHQRRNALRGVIDHATTPKNLEELQVWIDLLRIQANSPLAVCQQLLVLMFGTVRSLQQHASLLVLEINTKNRSRKP